MKQVLTKLHMETRACKAWNEDAVGGGENWLFVLDGATGLGGAAPLMAPDSDAAWFVRETAAWLEEHLPDMEQSLEEILQQGMAQIRSRWKGEESDLPVAEIALFRLRNGMLEHLGLGDCSASVQLKDGSFLTWEEENLTRLDDIAIQEAVQYSKTLGCSMAESRKLIEPTLIRHRNLRNTPEGYWTLDATGKGIPHARRGEIPAEQCRSVFLCSDGFAQLVGFAQAKGLPELHTLAETQGIPALMDRLYDLQAQDAAMTRLPRFKVRDDTSALWARVTEE